MTYLALLAVIAGAAIAIQAAMNANLGILLHNSVIAASVAFGSSLLFTLLGVIIFTKTYPSIDYVRSVPMYLWFSGGLSAIGISMFYYLIPKMGIGNMMTFALTGQIIASVMIGHFAWFDMPFKPFNTSKLVGLLALILGVYLINKES